jgi:hypothetical protein
MAIESSMVEITSIFLVNCQVDSKLEASVPTPEAAAAPEVVVDLRVRRDAFLTPPHPPHPARPKAGPRPAPATTEALCRDKRPVLALLSLFLLVALYSHSLRASGMAAVRALSTCSSNARESHARHF